MSDKELRDQYKKETGHNALVYAGLGRNELVHDYAVWLELKISKQLSTDELREQFEKEHGNWENCSKIHGQYVNGSVQNRWEAYQLCARANNLIKDGKQ